MEREKIEWLINIHLLKKRVRPAFMWDGSENAVDAVDSPISVVETYPKRGKIVHLLYYYPEQELLVQEFMSMSKGKEKHKLLGQILGYLCPTLHGAMDSRTVSYAIRMEGTGNKMLKKYSIYAEIISPELDNDILKHRIEQIKEGVRDFPQIYGFSVEMMEKF